MTTNAQPNITSVGTLSNVTVTGNANANIVNANYFYGDGGNLANVNLAGRAAGEVAPLMIVGVVKLAPTLPIDGLAPFLHLDRKFMHLGFHIYDLGFQSPDSDAARPMVFATTLLLIILVVCLNLGAITIRNRLRARFKGASF